MPIPKNAGALPDIEGLEEDKPKKPNRKTLTKKRASGKTSPQKTRRKKKPAAPRNESKTSKTKESKPIPKTVMDENNRPVLHLNDLDLNNLEGEADTYLSHLRVPPDKKEQQRLLAERKRLQLKREKEFARENEAALNKQKEEEKQKFRFWGDSDEE